MKKEQRQTQRELDYFEKMKQFIVSDIEDGRDSHALAGSIARPVDLLHKYMRLWGIKDLYDKPENQLSFQSKTTFQKPSATQKWKLTTILILKSNR